MLAALYAELGDVARLRLQVNRTNETALRFYRAKGFRVMLEADFDIGGGFLMQDYVMEKITP